MESSEIDDLENALIETAIHGFNTTDGKRIMKFYRCPKLGVDWIWPNSRGASWCDYKGKCGICLFEEEEYWPPRDCALAAHKNPISPIYMYPKCNKCSVRYLCWIGDLKHIKWEQNETLEKERFYGREEVGSAGNSGGDTEE